MLTSKDSQSLSPERYIFEDILHLETVSVTETRFKKFFMIFWFSKSSFEFLVLVQNLKLSKCLNMVKIV